MSTNSISLSRINPDFDYILDQLLRAAQSRATWVSFLTTDVGESLLEYISAIGEYDQYAISRTFEEMFSETADIDSSIYAITKMLGVRLSRKKPANTYFRLPDASNSGSSNVGTSDNDYIIKQAFNNPYYDSSIPLGGGATPDAARITDANKFYSYGKIKRIISAQFPASSQMIIKPYSRFSSSEGMLFNRLSIKFDPIVDIANPNDKGWFGYSENIDNQSLVEPALLYRGDISNKYFQATGQDFFSIISSESDFTVSNEDVDVFINSEKLDIAHNGLWNFRVGTEGSKVVQDLTTSKGKLHILFGTSLYGYKPTVNDTIQLRYAITKGAEDNTLSFKSNKLACLDYVIDNETEALIYPLINGTNQTTPREYSTLGPASFASVLGTKGVTQQDYKTIFSLYEGNLDVIVDGQRDLNKSSPTFMNLVRVTTYPKHNKTFNDLMFSEIKKKTMFSNEFYTTYASVDNPLYPILRKFNIRANVYCLNLVDLVTARQRIEYALLRLVDKYSAPLIGKMNIDIPRETILKTIRESVVGISYIELIEPTSTVISSMLPPTPKAFETTATAATNLVGSIDYALEVFCEDDNKVSSTSRTWSLGNITTTVGTPSGNQIKVYFEKVSNFTYTEPNQVSNSIQGWPYLRNVKYRLWRKRNVVPSPFWEVVSNTLVDDSSLTANPATNLTYILDTGTIGITPVPAYPEYNAAKPSVPVLDDNWQSVNTINMIYV